MVSRKRFDDQLKDEHVRIVIHSSFVFHFILPN
jgi:hypothetical protein